ncbi:MAG: thiamine diphosphokinase [Bacteroidales bacterium]|nr:thiamine diphosphokinase [Bacteroidales bacterium]
MSETPLRITGFVPDVTILGAGDYPSHPIPLSLLREAPVVQCCDGAALSYLEHEGKRPWRIVGDGDSLSEAFKATHRDILRQIDEQDFNDQTKNVKYAAAHQLKTIAIVGATGKREDHTLGNISLLIDYMEWGLNVRLYTNHGVFIPCLGNCCVEVPVGSAVSIFNFGCTELSSEGLQYSLYPTTRLWQATLNRTISPLFSIRANGAYLLFLNYPE